MSQLKEHFITTERPYEEGTVEVFTQKISSENISKAVITMTALGVYDAEIDDTKIGEDYLKPGYTYYPKHLQYQSYEVTDLLRKDAVLKVYLGQGWYCGRFTFDNKTQIYGDRPAVSWILTCTHDDGTVMEYCSDDPDVHAVKSPYIYAGEYDGEVIRADGNDQEIFPPVRYTGTLPEEILEGKEYIRVYEDMPVKAVMKHNDVTILDFGQNFAGIITIDPACMDADTVHLRFGELLNDDGSLYTTNLRKAKQAFTYTKGTDTKPYTTRFTYYGFRYVEVSGCTYKDGLLKVDVIHSEMQRTGHIDTGNEDVDRLYQNVIWGQKSNYMDVPTDCPQRDERMGYTGDGQVFARTGMYNFDTRSFWKKFLRDIRDSQSDNREGYIPSTVPAEGPAGIGFLTMMGWGSCDLIVPEQLYEMYGDDSFLKEQYDSMKTFAECEIRKAGKKGLWTSVNLGDWLAPGRGMAYMAMHHGPVSNSFLINDMRIMAETADHFGKKEDADHYNEEHARMKSAYCKAYLRKNGKMKDDYQGAYIMCLQYVLDPSDPQWMPLFETLCAKLKEEGMQTGFFATQFLLPLLCDHGQAKLAYDLLLSENLGGWMYEVKRGATTIWERWDALQPDGTVNESKSGNDNMVSFNHYAFGSVGEWMYRYMLGIRPLRPGFGEILLQPVTDERIGQAEGSYETPYGKVSSSWKYTAPGIDFTFDTPVKAEIVLPDGRSFHVEAGRHEYSITR